MQYKGVIGLILLIAVFLSIDSYVLNGLRGLKKIPFLQKKWFRIAFIVSQLLFSAGFVGVLYSELTFGFKLGCLGIFFVVLLFKLCFSIFVLIDDMRRYRLRKKQKDTPQTQASPTGAGTITRSEFLLKAGLLAGAIPLASLGIGMRSGAYDYHIKRHKLYLPNLPKSFDGMKLGQISDIHSGSFTNKRAVIAGVEMLMKEKADVIFFTGDIVNAYANEMNGYLDVFNKIKAPLGVYSCLGNHDYGTFGDYPDWQDGASLQRSADAIAGLHKKLGWDLLRNNCRRLKVNGEEIGILGSENWGIVNDSPRLARVDLALKNTEDLPVKLLLSHDPSHWRAQILPDFPQIDVMFAGHTHGMQMGIQTKHFQWSPIQYIYNEWAGFYNEGPQQLYVNVGYGFLDFEGRVGILPEITIFELKAAAAPSINA